MAVQRPPLPSERVKVPAPVTLGRRPTATVGSHFQSRPRAGWKPSLFPTSQLHITLAGAGVQAPSARTLATHSGF